MNWSRGKNRLIILFLSINILLAWANYKKASDTYVLKQNQIQAIKKVMGEHNIEVMSEIPKRYNPLKKLTVFPYQIDSRAREAFAKDLFGTLEGIKISVEKPKLLNEKPKRIYRKNDEVVTFEGEKIWYHHEGMRDDVTLENYLDINVAKKLGDKWLKKIGYSPKKMHTQIIEGANELQVVYYDQYEKMPVFDSYVKLKITPLGVTNAEIHKVKLGEATGEEETIYSADQVIFKLIKTIGEKETVRIKDIMVGYALENPKGTHLIAEKAIPFYYLVLESGKTYYIDAYNNEIRE